MVKQQHAGVKTRGLLRLVKDVNKVVTNLNSVFRAAADLKAELSIDEAQEATAEFPGMNGSVKPFFHMSNCLQAWP